AVSLVAARKQLSRFAENGASFRRLAGIYGEANGFAAGARVFRHGGIHRRGLRPFVLEPRRQGRCGARRKERAFGGWWSGERRCAGGWRQRSGGGRRGRRF